MDEGPPPLSPGEVIKQVYRVKKKIGEGGFGAIYLMEDIRNKQKYAMKVESSREPVQVLKMEVLVLKEVRKRGGRHVCKTIDRGRNENINYVIMTLVGHSLQELKKACPQLKFSIGCALRVGLQCMEALEDLHGIGYLHRDVKPANFACGREEVNEQRIIYILDFGLSRKYMTAKNEIRTPRVAAGFRGTVRYAPLNCHNSRELSRKDDLETWFYQQVEITKGKLPWSNKHDKDDVGRSKVQTRKTGELLQDAPRQYFNILEYIDGLKYWDSPDYEFIYVHLRAALNERGIRESDPYDWERGGQHRQQTKRLKRSRSSTPGKSPSNPGKSRP